MKKQIVKAAALFLALLMIVMAMPSCASRGKTVMELGSQTMSINLYEFFMSRQKGTLCTTYYYGADAKYDDFWRTPISSDGTTYNDYWTSYIRTCVENYLAALYLFEDEYGLTLPQSYIDKVDEDMKEFVDYDGEGSKSALNAILADYGVNYNMLREVYIMEQKIAYLQEYLYGADLSRIADEVKEEYYQDNYVRFKQVFFANYYYIYETDENGDTIYYDVENDKILYDKSTGIRKFDDAGNALKDKHGNVIYYHEDGSVAYDEVNGEPAYTFDADGKYMTAKYSAADLKEIRENAEEIVEFVKTGDTSAFEACMNDYSDDEEGRTLYPNGYYFTKEARYSYDYINDIIEKLGEMETGEIALVESEYGYHVVMKYELNRGAYSDKANAEWFEDFDASVANMLFSNKCMEYAAQIETDEELITTVDMSTVKPNYYY